MGRTAGEAGWRVSRCNAAAKIPDSDKIVLALYERLRKENKRKAEEKKEEP